MMRRIILSLCFFALTQLTAFAQTKTNFTQEEIDKIANVGSGLSGPGKPVKGTGWGGWRSGSDGVMYAGDAPKGHWSTMPPA